MCEMFNSVKSFHSFTNLIEILVYYSKYEWSLFKVLLSQKVKPYKLIYLTDGNNKNYFLNDLFYYC